MIINKGNAALAKQANNYKTQTMYQQRICILLIVMAGLLGVRTAKAQSDSIANLPVIVYSENPKKYEIADIKFEGMKNYEDYLLIGLSGLSVGQVISVPGDDITEAV